MASGDNTNLDEKIRARAVLLLEGASAVSSGIIQRELTFGGQNSVASQAYAVKSRIKAYPSIVKKVKDKQASGKYVARSDGTQTLYDVDDVTDLIGVRIITLYRTQIVEVIRSFLNILGKNEDSIFFAESIREIIVYSTDPDGDPQHLVKHVKNAFDASTFDLEVQVYSRPTKYSSIHIVIDARAESNPERRFIPVEIQIRTAFEDVWSEIEHQLKYKREEKVAHSAYSLSDDDIFQSTDRQLNILKSIIDGAAQHADEIKFQIDKLTEAVADASDAKQYEDSLPTVIQQLRRLNAGDDVLSSADKALKLQRSAIAKEFSPITHEERRQELEEARRKLERLIQQIYSKFDTKNPETQKILYLLRMEMGLCLTELGREKNETGLFYEALAVYGRISRDLANQIEPAIFLYRRARVLDLLGDDELAMELFEKVYNENLENVPKGHWLRFAVCRSLGFMYWDKADHLRKIAENTNDKGFELDRRKNLLLNACAVTAHLMNEKPDQRFFADQRSADREPVRIINNLLYFVIEFLDLQKDWAELEEHEIDEQRIREWISRLEEANERNIEQQARQLDTLRRALAFVGDDQKAVEKAQKSASVLKQIQNKRPLSSIEEDMMKEAIDFRDRASPDRGRPDITA